MRMLLALVVGILLAPIATADAIDAHVGTMESEGGLCPESRDPFQQGWEGEDYAWYENGTRAQHHCTASTRPLTASASVNGQPVANVETYGGDSEMSRTEEEGSTAQTFQRDDCDLDPETTTPCSGRSDGTFRREDAHSRTKTGILVGDWSGTGVYVARCQFDYTSTDESATSSSERGDESASGSETHRRIAAENGCAQGVEIVHEGQSVRPMLVLWDCRTTVDSRWDETHSTTSQGQSDSLDHDHQQRDTCAARPAADDGIQGTGTAADGTHVRATTWAGLDHRTHCTRTWDTERTCTYDNATAISASGSVNVLGGEHAIEERSFRTVSAQDVADVIQNRLVELGLVQDE